MAKIFTDLIPKNSAVYSQLKRLAERNDMVIFSGLPGVGKSLYVNFFCELAEELNRPISLIQWDVARKAFETDKILTRYPIVDNTVHDGVKLLVGEWLIQTVSEGLKNLSKRGVLIVEAPFIGHRFVELVRVQEDSQVEDFLSGPGCSVVVPIPSKEVRRAIEIARTRDVPEDAQDWSGAKPSVMLLLWKHLCRIASELGLMDNPEMDNPPYDPDIYEEVYRRVCQHRHYVPLHVVDLIDTSGVDEKILHKRKSIRASDREADLLFEAWPGRGMSDEELKAVTTRWYLT